ncbi:MAG: methyltransferase domain-containing protein [Nocardioidaceae bacterium]
MAARDEGQWRTVDEGWGRLAVDFATLSEPGNVREYTALHQALSVRSGDRLLDVACGSGLGLALAAARGATCAGIDAASRLVDVARDRLPGADLHVGDMHALPWPDEAFDVVTSFRGIWGTTTEALAEVLRVLVPGGRVGLTVWGHLKVSPGAWALRPFTLARDEQVAHQATMVALGRPGVGEELLTSWGFEGVRRLEIPFVWEFADPEHYARALTSTGPAYEAIQAVGEEAFHRYAVGLARERVRDGLPLRAEIDVVGYVARRPVPTTYDGSFLPEPASTPEVEALYADDVEDLGFVMNASRVWGHNPQLVDGLFAQLGAAVRAAGLTFRQRGVLVTACAATLGDSYCSFAWGGKLAGEAGVEVATGVLRGDDAALDDAERALARWARKVASDPNATGPADVQALRDAGFGDGRIHALTTFVALRLAFSTVNDALGARPDGELVAGLPAQVRDAVTFGRPAQVRR